MVVKALSFFRIESDGFRFEVSVTMCMKFMHALLGYDDVLFGGQILMCGMNVGS